MRKITVKFRVDNSGFDYDDEDYISVRIPDNLSNIDVYKVFQRCDKALRDDTAGECLYDQFGWNYKTLMDRVEEMTGWEWEPIAADVVFDI